MDFILDEKQHLQAFAQGKSFNSYEYLGAHKVDDGNCYVFRVWAPNAITVSVVGSFNNWDENANHMSRIGNGDVWECYINSFRISYCLLAELVVNFNLLFYIVYTVFNNQVVGIATCRSFCNKTV